MVGRSGGKLGGEQRPPGARKLIGMDAEPQTPLARGEEDLPGLFNGEGSFLAEDVAEAGQMLARAEWDELLREEADPFSPPLLELRRYLMREKRRDQAREIESLERGEEPQRANLLVHRQAVARLGLGRRRPAGEHPRESLDDGLPEHLILRRAGRPDRRENAAARGRDRSVALAREPEADLFSPVSGPDRVRVRVHEARQERFACRVERHGRRLPGEPPGILGLGPDEDENALLRAQSRFADPQDLALRGPAARRNPQRGSQTGRVADLERRNRFVICDL